MNISKKLLAGSIIASTAVVAPLQASAQATLEEIIVTASKRESSLQDTSIAVSAFTADAMEQLDINGPADLEALVPSLTWQQTPNRISIRGVGRFDNSLGISPGVAMYNDGVYNAEDAVLYNNAINVQRIEVLRGPQGTLYGRNTTGGAINVLSKRPTPEFEGDVRAKFGTDDYVRLDALISGPITDTLRYKLYYTDTEYDGWQENINGGPNGRANDSVYAEGQLEWDITEKLNLWVKYSGSDYDNTPGYNSSEDPYNCEVTWAGLGPAAGPFECAAGVLGQPSTDGSKVDSDNLGYTRLSDSANLTAQLSYEFEDMTLSYLYGSVKYNWDQDTDYDGTSNDYVKSRLHVGQYQEQESHELQLVGMFDTWNFVAGAYYFTDKNEQPYNIYADPTGGNQAFQAWFNLADGQIYANSDNLIYFQNGRLDNESYAIFGEATFELNEKWSITAGLRYSEDDYSGEESQIQRYDAISKGTIDGWAPFVGIPGALDILMAAPAQFSYDASVSPFTNDASRNTGTFDLGHESDFSNVTGKITLDYRPIEDHLIWLTYSTGYKMGGVRLGALESVYAQNAYATAVAAAGSADGIPLPSDGKFDQEDVATIEMGWKADLLDRTLRTELVAFYNDYENMQQTRDYQVPGTTVTLAEVVTVDTEMWGVEWTATYLFNENLSAIWSSSYNNTELVGDLEIRDFTYNARDEFGEQIPDNAKGNKLSLTPASKHAVSLHYVIPSDFGDFSMGGTYAYVGKRYFGVANYNSEDSYTRLDLQASWTSVSEKYQILATVNNATDELNYNTYACSASSDSTFGTSSFQSRCGGNPMDMRRYAVQFVAKF